jgi:hypothetical protein
MRRLAQPFPSGARTKADEQAVLAQEPQPLTTGGPEARHAQPCPDLAVTLPMEGRGREDGPDRLDQLRPWPGRPRWPGRQAMALDGDPRRTPDPARPRQRAAALKGRDLGLQQLRPEPPPSSRALRRSLSSTSPPLGRIARLASPAARKSSRRPLRGAAVTPNARETVSKSSPRSSRSTASRLRTDIRPPRPEPAGHSATSPPPAG